MNDSSEKVAIITFQGNFNYGNRLQNYAVDTIYKGMGISPTSLVLRRRQKLLTRLKREVKSAFGISGVSPEQMMTLERAAAFERFNSMMSFQVVDSLDDELIESFDWFSVGSDQIWYLDKGKEDEDWRFLQFVPASKRITVSPSFGRDLLGNAEGRRLRRYLDGFVNISVREERGAEFIKLYTGKEATVTCDPTLVLKPEDWRIVSDDRLTPKEPYVFTYLLGGIGPEAADVLEKATDHFRIPVIQLSDSQKQGEPDAGPAEFISLIDNAIHVITDSFHAAVFSCIMQTPLTIIHRQGGANMFGRLETLASMLGIEQKVYGSSKYNYALAAEYGGVPEAIDCERQKFMSFLRGCLETQQEKTRGARCD